MRKKNLIEALLEFDDEDHITIGGEAWSWVPKIERICGKTQSYMPFYCINEPNHEGDCYCGCKDVSFDPNN